MPQHLTRNNFAPRRRTLLFALTGLALLALCASGLNQPVARAAASYTVNTTGDNPDSFLADGVCNDGSGNCSLRAALMQALFSGGVITINITANGTINLNSPLPDITDNMTISGPGSGLLTVRRNSGDFYRIFTIGFERTVSISGLTITNGRTRDGFPPAQGFPFGDNGAPGGGIASEGDLTLTDVVVTGNRTGNGSAGPSGGGVGGWGGGIYCIRKLTMTNVVVSNNTAGNGGTGGSGGDGGQGGGVFSSGGASGATVTMTNVVITNNKSGDGGIGSASGGGNGGVGGGISGNTAPLSLTNVTISGNEAGDGGTGSSGTGGGGLGGGLYISQGTQATLLDTVVINNSAGDGSIGGWGGGIFNNGTTTATRVNVSGNSTGVAVPTSSNNGGNGGGIYNSFAMTMLNSTVSGNNARGISPLGGGIFSSGHQMSLTNTTISGNQASPTNASNGGRGGGLYNTQLATLTNVTITANSAYTCCAFKSGQGVHNDGSITVSNTIIAGNGNGSRPDVTGNFNSLGRNLVGRASNGTSGGQNGDQSGFGLNGDIVGSIASPIDPRLGPLADNGGPTQTHALLDGSPALDAGDNARAIDANGAQLTTDQRGAARFAGPSNDVDIGAYEFHPPTLEDIADKVTNEDTPLSVTFNVGDGAATVTSITAVSSNQTLLPDSGLSLSGSGAVRSLLMTPAANQSGSTQITISVTYSNSTTESGSFQLTVTPVNDAPSFTKGADQTVAEDAGPQTVNGWATAVSPGPNESGQAVSFLVTNNSNAALFTSAPAVGPTGTLTYTAAPNASGTATITLVAKDDGGTANGGQDTSATQTFTITVTPVNDPPVAQDQSVTTAEDTSVSITFAATDIENNSLTFSVVSGPTHGTLSGTGSSRTYTPAANYNGPDSFTFKATDSGGADSQTATVSINVTAVNDAPVNNVPAAQATDQNTPLVFSNANSNAISVADIDAGSDPLRVTLTATNGVLTLGGTAGLTFTAGDGTDDATLTFSGTLNNLNAALNGLAFKPNAGFNGAASLQITTNDQGFNGSGGARTDTDFVNITVRPGSIEFKQSSYTAAEGSAGLAVVVRRTGDTSRIASVAYATDDGSVPAVSVPCASTTGAALDRCDFTKALGRLTFAPGETEKTITVLVGDDSYVEGNETALIRLSNVLGSGVVLGSRTSATLEITDDAQESSTNPIDDTGRFVRQHYQDFLNREPDAAGLAFWTNEIESCGADLQCREVKRVNVSAAFFLSIEFQGTGYLVYRLDKVAFGNLSAMRPVPLTLTEFLADTQEIGRGVVVGADGWDEQLEANKRSFIDAFVLRTRFLNRYPAGTTPELYVDTLNANAGGVLSQAERDALVNDLRGGAKTRAQVLRAVAEHPAVARREFNQAFVLMQFFGYLRRDPDSAPDADFSGYNFWLSKLNEFNGDYIRAEMVKAFISSDEYRRRFGQ